LESYGFYVQNVEVVQGLVNSIDTIPASHSNIPDTLVLSQICTEASGLMLLLLVITGSHGESQLTTQRLKARFFK
jgi:hypothetical protein